ncbi:tyrosine-type recombinase/integrase [Salipiger thiooxidans]|uniref:site-specific integrase n=1 Tax=Salipiger thiooxidans TaxID=282683 RepID=UPI001A8C8338|nr:tyrosine-type recombinase/integrase [Salipiger thiooxidans]MBN8189495.1 tyrosine-type recombinase/integrase [Salipiger thiooxidans]
MEAGDVRLRYPGLVPRRRAGKIVGWRVRVEGDVNRKITLAVGPDHTDFHLHYRAARMGERLDAPQDMSGEHGTMGWLMAAYLKHLEQQVNDGLASPLTLKERKSLGAYVLDQESEQRKSAGRKYAGLPVTIPAAELEAFKDRMAAKPGKARNVWKLLTAAYDFGMKRNMCSVNPARAVSKPIYRSQGGATPWTVKDLERFREHHEPGSMAHLALSLFMFTACRIGDAYWLGRGQEMHRQGATWLEWQPGKKGSRPVSIPMMAPLERAIRSQVVVGDTYLLTSHGKPFASPEALRNKMKEWVRAAGLPPDRSSHGIRKAAGHLLALHGATQYEIMAVHGHANASTSQVYTETVERMKLGEMAVQKLAGMDW